MSTKKPKQLNEEKKSIVEQINSINSRFLSLRDDQFKDIATLALVGGESSKAYAICSLIKNPTYNVRLLCTDEQAADVLLTLAAG